MTLLVCLLVSLTGIGLEALSWFDKWPAIPVAVLVVLLPVLYVIDHYATMEGLKRGQEEVNPIVRKFFLTGDWRRDLIIPVLLMVGIALFLGADKQLSTLTYLFLGMYLGVFLNNQYLDMTAARSDRAPAALRTQTHI